MAVMTTSDTVDAVRVTLSDGREVTVRRLLPADGHALELAIARADPWDLRKRFMGCPPPVRVLVAQLSRADGVHDLPLGAFTDDGRLVGVAQFDRSDDEPVAEMAVEVAKDWQHVGLGTQMVDRLAELAREQGIHGFTASYYADNVPIRRLLRDVGRVTTSSIESGQGYAELDIDPVLGTVGR